MGIEQFYYLVEIEKQGNLSKAAQALFISQSSLTTTLKNLEKELGFPIFYRSQKGTVPTPKGVKVLQLTHKMLTNIDQLQQLDQVEPLPQRVKIIITPAFTSIMISFAMNYEKTLAHPIKIDFIEAIPWEIIENIRKRVYTIGLVGILKTQADYFAEKFTENQLKVISLATGPISLFMSPDHPLAHQEVITIKDLYQEQIYSYNLDNTAWWNAFNLPSKLPIKKIVDQEIVKRLIAANKGVGLFPELFGQHDIYLKNQLIVNRPLEDFPYQGSAYLVYPGNLPLSATELDIIQHLQVFIANKSINAIGSILK